jgi:hypothetical protein
MSTPNHEGKYQIGYSHWGKPRFNGEVAKLLARRHDRELPDFSHVSEVPDWINSNFTYDQIDAAWYTTRRAIPQNARGRALGARGNNNGASRERNAAEVSLEALQDAQKRLEAIAASRAATPQIDTSQFVLKSAFDVLAHDVKGLHADINALHKDKPTIVHIQPVNPELPAIDMGLQHCSFPDLLLGLQARQFNGLPLNAWLYGPAGTGKSKACEAAIRALGLEFRGNGKTIDKMEVMGYTDGYGKYHTTPFREAYEHGHGYCADEIDSWSPEATVALQGALAGDWAAFADGMVKRHPKFLFIAAGNTTGKGATIEYVGRMQQDAAFLDRFYMLDWPHDNGLENALVTHKDWLAYVRKVRDNLARQPEIRNHLVTMRASIHGEALLAAGMTWDKTINMCLRKGLPAASWDKIK